MKWLSGLFIGLMLWTFTAHSEVISLHVPFVVDAPKQNYFYHELLSTAIQDAGHTPKLTIKKIPHLRAKNMLESGKVSILWMVESKQRNQEFIPIEVGLTNGLIGNRILFIKQGDQPLYDKVKTLDDFRQLNLMAGLGKGWFDGRVWKENNLSYKENYGNWTSIFKMIMAGRDYHYFPRGLNEIMVEARQFPELSVEKKLVLIYDRDFRFYLSKEGPNAGKKYQDILSSVMNKAKQSGLIDRLIRKYWGNDFDALNYDQRQKIYLETPK